MVRPQATSTEDLNEQQSSSGIDDTAEELDYEPVGGSVVNQYLGRPLNTFSRPTQILTPEEVRQSSFAMALSRLRAIRHCARMSVTTM